MKYAAFLLLLVFNVAFTQKSTPKTPVPFWNEFIHKFGKIPQNQPVTVNFWVTNKGKTDLSITDVKTTCGCTVAEWTKTPIKSGKKGFVKVTFSAKEIGEFHKPITVFTNAGETILAVTGFVESEYIKAPANWKQ